LARIWRLVDATEVVLLVRATMAASSWQREHV
jgi:hypothetical protein